MLDGVMWLVQYGIGQDRTGQDCLSCTCVVLYGCRRSGGGSAEYQLEAGALIHSVIAYLSHSVGVIIGGVQVHTYLGMDASACC